MIRNKISAPWLLVMLFISTTFKLGFPTKAQAQNVPPSEQKLLLCEERIGNGALAQEVLELANLAVEQRKDPRLLLPVQVLRNTRETACVAARDGEKCMANTESTSGIETIEFRNFVVVYSGYRFTMHIDHRSQQDAFCDGIAFGVRPDGSHLSRHKLSLYDYTLGANPRDGMVVRWPAKKGVHDSDGLLFGRAIQFPNGAKVDSEVKRDDLQQLTLSVYAEIVDVLKAFFEELDEPETPLLDNLYANIGYTSSD